MSNKKYLLLCVLIFLFFSIIEIFKEDDNFSGRIRASSCVDTGKSEISIELTVIKDIHERKFYFGVKGHLCQDAIKLFTPNNDVLIIYSSLYSWFTDVKKVYLDGKEIPLRTY